MGKLNGGSKSQAVRHWKKQTVSFYLRLYMHARKQAGGPSQKMKSIKRNPYKSIVATPNMIMQSRRPAYRQAVTRETRMANEN